MTSYKDTAVLLIDPYNDYIHPEGKGYGLCKESLEETDTVTHMKALVKATRANSIPIFTAYTNSGKQAILMAGTAWVHFTVCSKKRRSAKKVAGEHKYTKGWSQILPMATLLWGSIGMPGMCFCFYP